MAALLCRTKMRTRAAGLATGPGTKGGHLEVGAMTAQVVVLIGTGWSYMTPFLRDREKRILMIVIPLQVKSPALCGQRLRHWCPQTACLCPVIW